jgi:hypothetical protein
MGNMDWLTQASNNQRTSQQEAQKRLASTPAPPSSLVGLGVGTGGPSPSGFLSPHSESMFKGIQTAQKQNPVVIPFKAGTKTLQANQMDIDNEYRQAQADWQRRFQQEQFDYGKERDTVGDQRWNKEFENQNYWKKQSNSLGWANHNLSKDQFNYNKSSSSSSDDGGGVPKTAGERKSYYTSALFGTVSQMQKDGYGLQGVVEWMMKPEQQKLMIQYDVNSKEVIDGLFRNYTGKGVDLYYKENPDHPAFSMLGSRFFDEPKDSSGGIDPSVLYGLGITK